MPESISEGLGRASQFVYTCASTGDNGNHAITAEELVGVKVVCLGHIDRSSCDYSRRWFGFRCGK